MPSLTTNICGKGFQPCEPVTLPCCEIVVYCKGCMETICPEGRGRCPTCKEHLRVDSAGVLSVEHRQQCKICYGMHVLTDEERCAACTLGATLYFRYECNRCNQIQKIPHPMWRYQKGPHDYSTASWACHQGCKTTPTGASFPKM
mmetsp:Transcript_73730/g.117319  ORF Transcript_73730/g.117319 Transcript_73730/m.117319 type:complete len:145 (+) Transcript_73730:51-485(+)